MAVKMSNRDTNEIGGYSPPGLNGFLSGSPLVLALSHPVSVGALILLAINDHLLKPQVAKTGNTVASALTGKLSDVAGMVFFPLLLASLFELGGRLGRRPLRYHRLLVLSVLMVAIFFAAINLSNSMGAFYAETLGFLQWPLRLLVDPGGDQGAFVAVEHIVDPTDALAVVAVMIPYWIGRSSLTRKMERWAAR